MAHTAGHRRAVACVCLAVPGPERVFGATSSPMLGGEVGGTGEACPLDTDAVAIW